MPATAEQMPSALAPSAMAHTSQAPAQAESQQSESEQKPVWHSAATPQLAPSALSGTQAPEMQAEPAAQWEGTEQVVGQAEPAARQRYGEQEGLPGPLTCAHTPLEVAPAETLQALHAPLQALLQQKPSTQAPEAH